MRPCGIIVLLAELFKAESVSQVYATLHEFLRKHQHAFEKLGTKIFLSFLNWYQLCIVSKISYAMMMAVICASSSSTLKEKCNYCSTEAIRNRDCNWQAAYGRPYWQVVQGKLWSSSLPGTWQSMYIILHVHWLSMYSCKFTVKLYDTV